MSLAAKAVEALLVGGSLPLVLRWLTAQPRTSNATEIRYTSRQKVFATVMMLGIPALVLSLVSAQHRPLEPSEAKAVMALIAGFFILGAPLWLEFTRVHHRFDEQRLQYHSPWSAERTLRWTDVTALRWRPGWKYLDLVTADSVFRFSPMADGLPAFARVALAQIRPEVLSAHPEGHAVLRLLEAGANGVLAMTSESPMKLVMRLPAVEGSDAREQDE